MAKVIIFGVGDIAQMANYYFSVDSEHDVVAFTVDGDYLQEASFEGKPVIAFEEITKLYSPSEFKMFIALSYSKMNKVREAKYRDAKEKGYILVSYVSSRCSYLSQHPCGDNCLILEDNTIQPFVKIGNNVTLWSGNHIGHHSVIHDHNFISSHVVVSGHCEIRSHCFLGVNSTLHNDVILSKETLVAAGAIISHHSDEKSVYIPPDTVYVGNVSNRIKLK